MQPTSPPAKPPGAGALSGTPLGPALFPGLSGPGCHPGSRRTTAAGTAGKRTRLARSLRYGRKKPRRGVAGDDPAQDKPARPRRNASDRPGSGGPHGRNSDALFPPSIPRHIGSTGASPMPAILAYGRRGYGETLPLEGLRSYKSCSAAAFLNVKKAICVPGSVRYFLA
jgi:hypothetical protein